MIVFLFSISGATKARSSSNSSPFILTKLRKSFGSITLSSLSNFSWVNFSLSINHCLAHFLPFCEPFFLSFPRTCCHSNYHATQISVSQHVDVMKFWQGLTVCTMWLYVCPHDCAIYCTTFNIASIWYNLLHKPKYCTIILTV